MELLIFNKDQEKKGGYARGDIVEVRPDGYWTAQHGYNRNAFRLVVKKGAPIDNTYISVGDVCRRVYRVNELDSILKKEGVSSMVW